MKALCPPSGVPLARRQFLKGVTLGASGFALNPLLQRMARAAEGQPAAPRFLFVVEGNGLPPLQVHPAGIPYIERARREKLALHSKRNLLDHMQEDVARVRQRIGRVDREKLDAYLSAYETLQGQSARLVETRDRLAKAAPVPDDKFASTVETDRLDAHFELAAAMIGGLTNVATIASGVGFPYFNITFSGLGIDQGKHPIGHSLYVAEDKVGWERTEKIRRFHFELIARFMRKLQTMPEGNGTMLDNTVIVYLSDAAEIHHSRCFEWPMVVLGNVNGRLQTGGRYIVYPDYGRPGHRTINTFYNTLLHAAGRPRDDFGQPDPNLDKAMHGGPLGELLA